MTDTTEALRLMKARLNRLESDTSLDEVFNMRLAAAADTLENRHGIRLTDSVRHLELLVDLATWMYQNRDTPGRMPDWLRLRLREEWLTAGGDQDAP